MNWKKKLFGFGIIGAIAVILAVFPPNTSSAQDKPEQPEPAVEDRPALNGGDVHFEQEDLELGTREAEDDPNVEPEGDGQSADSSDSDPGVEDGPEPEGEGQSADDSSDETQLKEEDNLPEAGEPEGEGQSADDSSDETQLKEEDNLPEAGEPEGEGQSVDDSSDETRLKEEGSQPEAGEPEGEGQSTASPRRQTRRAVQQPRRTGAPRKIYRGNAGTYIDVPRGMRLGVRVIPDDEEVVNLDNK